MAELRTYQFPTQTSTGLLLGLSAPRLAAVGAAGVVFVVVMASPTATSLVLGAVLMGLLAAAAAVRVGGRPAIEWLPVAATYGWATLTGNTEFYASPDLSNPLPEPTLDLPGELFGLELHGFEAPASTASVANPTPAAYGVVVDTFRNRLIAVAEVSGADFLFLDPGEQQARVTGWGAVLDHVAQSMPELVRLQLLHLVGPASTQPLLADHDRHGGRGTETTAASYRQVLERADAHAQEHRLLLAIALDRSAARRQIRQAGRGTEGAARLLMDRAATLEEALTATGIEVSGWLPARAIAQVLRTAFDPAADRAGADRHGDVTTGGGTSPAVAGPAGMAENWSTLRHDSGWSTTLQVAGPPTRPVTGDFLQHLLIGVPARRRMSLLYVPTPMATAERRAQTEQVSTESEQALRTRLGFGASARQRREQGDAARREADLVAGRAVYRLVWLLTVTADDPQQLEAAVAEIEAAGRRCALELRRLSGTQRQAAAFTLPLCRGAR